MREKVVQFVRDQGLLRAGDRVAVAVSGGADSVALLRVLQELKAELGVVLSVAHFNHHLRAEQSDADEAFVAALAKETRLEVWVGHGDVGDHAATSRLSIEAAARELRYRWFAELAREQRLDAIATAHTLDDQAETVLLKFLRGAWTRGLGGVYPVAHAGTENSRVVRPMLGVSRQEVEAYLTSIGQTWREDESNLDRRFLRNRVRHDLLPLLEREFNPNMRSALSDLAEIARGEEAFWRALVSAEINERTSRESREPEDATISGGDRNVTNRLELNGFSALPAALQRRLLKRFAEEHKLTLDFAHVERLRDCASGKISKVELPGGVVASISQRALVLGRPVQRTDVSYTCVLQIPGEVAIPEAGLLLRAFAVSPDFAAEAGPGTLLNLDLIGSQLVIRNWLPGDRFWPAHSRSEEKLKRLFLEKKIPAGDRPGWPVAFCRDTIVWVRGLPVAHTHQWRGVGEALQIEALEL